MEFISRFGCLNPENRSALASNTTVHFKRRAERLSGTKYPKRRKLMCWENRSTRCKEVLPPLHAPNTTNRSALASNTTVHFKRRAERFSGTKYPKRRKFQVDQTPAHVDSSKCSAPEPVEKTQRVVGALQFPQFATADPGPMEFISRFGCLDTTNRSALASNTTVHFKRRAERFSGTKYPKRLYTPPML